MRPGTWRSALAVVSGFGVLLGLAFLVGMPRQQIAQMRRLPEALRADLYQRTLYEVKSICTLPASSENEAIRDHCAAEAHFVISFPECDHECQVFARAVLPHAHR